MNVRLVVNAVTLWIPILSAVCTLVAKGMDAVDATKNLKGGKK